MPSLRLHITGASGCGVTTLGASLAERLQLTPLDTDDFFWQPTNPPYTVMRPAAERAARLVSALGTLPSPRWVISGSLMVWGDFIIPQLSAVVFLSAPTDVRLERLRRRELARFGSAAISEGGSMHSTHLAFLEWAAAYDTSNLSGRSRARHEAWLAQLPCPVLRFDSSTNLVELSAEVINAIRKLN